MEVLQVAYYNETELWKDVKTKEWDDWKWQVENRIDTVEKLKKIINIAFTILEQGINTIEETKFPLDNQYEMLLTDGDKFHLSIDIENTAKEINKYIYSLD